jgi:hypothetical protein
MLETLFESFQVTTETSLSAALLTLLSALAAGVLISFTYMKTAGKKGYSQGFALTLVLTPAVVAAIIFLIGSNVARAFSLAGAFSLIRFRSAPGEPKDIAYVLFAMAAGLGSGAGLYGYALLFVVLLCLIMVILHLSRFGAKKELSAGTEACRPRRHGLRRRL